MQIVAGDMEGRKFVLEAAPVSDAGSRRLTFAEEADWCRAQAKTLSRTRDAAILLRIACAFDALHASIDGGGRG